MCLLFALFLCSARGCGQHPAGLSVDVSDLDVHERNEPAGLPELTDAEARICSLLYQSYNLPDVARKLGISINTAKTHLNRSYRKLGVQSQSELVRKLAAQLYLG